MGFVQAERLISITTPLGEDALLLEGLSGQEAMSRPFQFALYLLSEDPNIDFEQVVGKPATVCIGSEQGSERYINGIISQFSQGSVEMRMTRYHATLVPWLWNLGRAADCRIFQDKSVPDILQEVFQERGFRDFRMAVSRAYPPRTYCVQYRETDFDFVSRLMEEEGIFYFFEHSPDQHVLVLGDSPSAHAPCPGRDSAYYSPMVGRHGEDSVTSWLQEQEVRPAKCALRDYNFETPTTDLSVDVPTLMTVGRNDSLEVYDYPGRYLTSSDGTRYVRLRMEEQETPHTRVSGTSDCRNFVPGYLFDLTGHYRASCDGSYLLTSVTHDAVSNLRGDGFGSSYSNSFTCIPRELPFRPARATPKAVVQGVQTAVVVGPSSEEIYTDKYGRVKVQFHWDRQGHRDEKSSCWIRVGSLWAGRQWGNIQIPRIGQEVLVAFLEGDPDQPIIVGSVYNDDQMPPYALPANQTQSGTKSRSSKGGGADNFNELRFEDKEGQEEVYLHAERNLTTVVEKDESREVGHDRTTKIAHDETTTIQNDRSATVASNDTETVGGSQTVNVGSNQSCTIGGSETHTVGGTITVMSGAAVTITVGATTTITSAGPVTITAPMITLNAGMVMVSGVVQCTTLITNSVVSPLYTPGVGNLI